jgi:hypothetical protein
VNGPRCGCNRAHEHKPHATPIGRGPARAAIADAPGREPKHRSSAGATGIGPGTSGCGLAPIPGGRGVVSGRVKPGATNLEKSACRTTFGEDTTGTGCRPQTPAGYGQPVHHATIKKLSEPESDLDLHRFAARQTRRAAMRMKARRPHRTTATSPAAPPAPHPNRRAASLELAGTRAPADTRQRYRSRKARVRGSSRFARVRPGPVARWTRLGPDHNLDRAAQVSPSAPCRFPIDAVADGSTHLERGQSRCLAALRAMTGDYERLTRLRCLTAHEDTRSEALEGSPGRRSFI